MSVKKLFSYDSQGYLYSDLCEYAKLQKKLSKLYKEEFDGAYETPTETQAHVINSIFNELLKIAADQNLKLRK